MVRNKYLITILFCFLTVFWVSLSIILLAIAMPYNPISGYITNERSIKSIIPEGWGFFTKSPRDEALYTFILKSNVWIPYSGQNNSNAFNFFGINRNAREKGILYSTLLKQLNGSDWASYKNVGLRQFNNIHLKTVIVNNSTDDLEFCSQTLLLVQTSTIPWAWSNSVNGTNGIVAHVAKIYVNCNRKN